MLDESPKPTPPLTGVTLHEGPAGPCLVSTRGGARTGAGRAPGATSIRRRVIEICEKMNLNVTEELVKIIQEPSTPLDIRSRLLQDMHAYVAPKLKAIEVRVAPGDDRPIEIVSYRDVKAEELTSDI